MTFETPAAGLFADDSQTHRCAWCQATPLYRHYHDTEWGVPVADERRLFEKICLEGFQSGLSWLTILRKRENFRAAFVGFEISRVAEMGDADIERLHLVLPAGQAWSSRWKSWPTNCTSCSRRSPTCTTSPTARRRRSSPAR